MGKKGAGTFSTESAISCRSPALCTTLNLYMGSGSSGNAAMREGFHFIGIERDADENDQPLSYMAISEARIDFWWHRCTRSAAACR